MNGDVRVSFPDHGRVELVTHEAPDPEPHQVRVSSVVSLMSTGTECTVLHGDFDASSHFSWFATMPFSPGYLTVGEVEAVGDEVTDVAVGGRVFHRRGHASRHTLAASAVTPVPDRVTDDEAVWAGLGKIAYRTAVAAPFRLGGTVAVIGFGQVGQMAVRLAAAAGCARIVAVGRSTLRLDTAARGGATDVVAGSADEAVDAVREVLGGAPSVVVDATGSPEAFGPALRMADWHGTVVLLGDTGHPSAQRLSSDVMVKGLVVTATHDLHDWHGGDEATVMSVVTGLMGTGRLDCSGMITHRFPPRDAADAYRLAGEHRGDTVGIAFDWTAL